MPVAVNCCKVPSAMSGLVGVTAIDCKTAELTVSVVAPLIPLAASVAVIIVRPTERPSAKPPATDATAEFEELQTAELVKSSVAPSLKIPIAVNCSLVPLAIDG